MKYRKTFFEIQNPLYSFSRKGKSPFPAIWNDENGQRREIRGSLILNGFDYDIVTVLRLYEKTQEISVKQIYDALRLGGKVDSWRSKIASSLDKIARAKFSFSPGSIRLREFPDHEFTTNLMEIHKGRGGRWKIKTPVLVCRLFEEGQFQWYSLDEYLAIPTGIPRRLWEFLERRAVAYDGKLDISDEKISRYIPIQGRYLSDRMRVLDRAVSEIPGWTDTPEVIHHFRKVVVKEEEKQEEAPLPTKSPDKAIAPPSLSPPPDLSRCDRQGEFLLDDQIRQELSAIAEVSQINNLLLAISRCGMPTEEMKEYWGKKLLPQWQILKRHPKFPGIIQNPCGLFQRAFTTSWEIQKGKGDIPKAIRDVLDHERTLDERAKREEEKETREKEKEEKEGRRRALEGKKAEFFARQAENPIDIKGIGAQTGEYNPNSLAQRGAWVGKFAIAMEQASGISGLPLPLISILAEYAESRGDLSLDDYLAEKERRASLEKPTVKDFQAKKIKALQEIKGGDNIE